MLEFDAKLIHSVLRLSFYSPKTANSFDLPAALKLREFYSENQYSAILFRSSHPKVFCSGGNLRTYALSKINEGKKINKQIREILVHFQQLPVPKVALVEGDVYGGGLELLSCFDHIIALPHTQFCFWQRKMALSFGWGGGERLRARLGPKVLEQLSLQAASLSCHKALQIGLIDEIASAHNLQERADSYITKQKQLPRIPFGFLKDQDKKDESKIFEQLWGNPEHIQILRNFIKKN